MNSSRMNGNPDSIEKRSPEELRAELRERLHKRLGSTGGWYPLSHGQEALYFLWRLAPGGAAYNLVVPVGVRGALDAGALRRAFQALSDRHPCLRTEFREAGGQLAQRAIAGHPVHFEEVDAAGWSRSLLDAEARARARQAFDLAADATLRATLFRQQPERHLLVMVLHHIVGDLWSLIVMMDELKELYAAARAGRAAELPPLPLSYEDHVRWQRRAIAEEAGERSWQYWREELAGDLPLLDLPADRSRPPLRSFAGGTLTRRLDPGLAAALKAIAAGEGVTLYMALLAAYVVLLHRYTGQDEILVGTPTSGRQRAELAGIVGDFVNLVALRADLAGGPTFRELLAEVRRKVVGAMKHQDFPLSLIVERLQPERDLSRAPLFQTSFVLQRFHRFEELTRAIVPGEGEGEIPFGELALEPWPLPQQDGQFDLNLEMKEDDGGGLMAAFKYSADLFEPATVERMAGLFETLLRQIVASPGARVADLRLLTGEETRAAVADARGPRLAEPANGPGGPPGASSFFELFAASAARHAEALAIVEGEEALTYAELHARAEDRARRLAGLGVGPEVLVALSLPRGIELVVTLLAIARCGGAFLPLDPRHPEARNLQIVAASGAPLLLAPRAERDGLASALLGLAEERRPRLFDLGELGRLPAAAPPAGAGGASLAYVLFTSGSTGRPKGVMVEQRGMINHLLAKLSDLGMDERDVLAQTGPQSFDIVVWQCVAPLLGGGRVAVIADADAEDPARLAAEVARLGVSVVQLVPSMLHALLAYVAGGEERRAALAGLRFMVPTGDALPTELCRRWLALYPGIPVMNTYGSTECSDDQCHCVFERLAPADEAVAVAPIGTPIRNMAAYVLDGGLAPAPAGVVGELYIGGLGVGRGYLEDPRRTATAFVPDPFGGAGARLYRTRDLVRRRADLTLDFLGRVDSMIKLRGNRIEPGEIVSALCRHPAVAEAVVVAREHPSGERQLVGYLVPAPASPDGPAPAPDPEAIRAFVAELLPQSMVPAMLCVLDALPLTAHGKLDLRRLPPPAWPSAAAREYVAPRSAEEATLARIWAETLGRERVGVTDHFFAIGGDSISSIQIVARCKEAGLAIGPTDIFLHPTIAALAVHAAAAAARSRPAAAPAPASASASFFVSPEHLELAFLQVKLDEA